MRSIFLSDFEECKDLWKAVILQAEKDIEKADKKVSCHRLKSYRELRRDEALFWIKSYRDDVGSFNWVCEVLGYDPASKRKAMLNGLEVRHVG